ncbi:GGDEF domain-containing protein [Geomonas sp.]|uniref:GGDEF domain-containing protein n=1 Tax=Geomonas sp. TaxID=2651584 RepID=UPI002B4AA196|nr:HAMP domain-containing protein [Geomonas sp.]HJV33540.1 HAMP domain-containing protein [Geomonas sp.]
MQNPGSKFNLSRLSLIQKIAAGYLAMAFFTSAALIFSYLHLHAVNQTAREIASKDLPVIGALIKLRSSLLAQESYAGKYVILTDPAFTDLFRQREKDSLAQLAVVRGTASAKDAAHLQALYDEYHKISELVFSERPGSEEKLSAAASRMLAAVDDLYAQRQDMLQTMLERSNRQQTTAMTWTIVISCVGFLLAVGVAPIITYRTYGEIRELQKATHRIAAGDFDFSPPIEGEDEIGVLAKDFTQMAARLKELEQMNLEASPLTRLPGNTAIERELEDRLNSGSEFAFCYADLDNFKPFSDRYGYAKGSELLRVTGDIIEATVREICGEQGFVGHVGGDDFVMVVPPDQAAAVCEKVIELFDVEALSHFAPEDRTAGGIEGTDRYGVQRFFPITTISVAVILCGGEQFRSAVDIARAAAKAKDAAKEHPGSSYLITRQEQAT